MRKIIKLMEDWSFTNKDGKKLKVNLPHTWNNIDGQDGGNDYYRGTLVYEKSFVCPEFDSSKELVYLCFDGVNASAKVIINNKEVITHDGGYSTFRADITSYLKDKNTLKVEVDNSINDRVYPQRADFTFYGGIYRDVYFLIVNKHHFNLDYHGGIGVKATPAINKTEGRVFFHTWHTHKNEKVVVTLIDAEDRTLASYRGDNGTLICKNIHLWNGTKDPYLYTFKACLYFNTILVDEVSFKIGFRDFYFDPKKGFFLNGEYYPLHGVSRHQDRKEIGNAITYEMMEEDMALIKEVGANTIRLAHYQHNQKFYDLCDKLGMIVWAEIPYISEHLVNGNENTKSQMQELIIQNYHHASIVTWGLSNEITIKDKHRKEMLKNHRELNDLVHDFDKTRPTSLACFAMCTPFHPVTKISDIIGWNLYLGWYVPGLFLNDMFISFYHMIRPNSPLCYSEYGAEGMPNLHSIHPHRGDHTEEYQAHYHEYMLKCFNRHPYMWGHYVWNMFDFAADARNQGGEPGMNHKGLVTFDRKTKKDSFYLYKAYWSDEKFIHICGKRFTKRNGRTLKIKVYSTLKELTCYCNGKRIQTKKGDKVFVFKLKNTGISDITITDGLLKDTISIAKVNKRLHEYRLKKGDSKNWM